jgi:hypothetical protein
MEILIGVSGPIITSGKILVDLNFGAWFGIQFRNSELYTKPFFF